MRQMQAFAESSGRRRCRGLRLTALLLVLFAVLAITSSPFLGGAAAQSVWTGIDRVVAIGDLHGDYDNFIKILKDKEVGLVDENLRWAAGKAHFVQTGDVLDRGDKAKKILDLLRNLETEALKAGGMVHFLLGNHEELALMNRSFERADYVSIEQFKSFLPEPRRQELETMEKQAGVNREMFWQNEMENVNLQEIYFGYFNEHYGDWLAQHNVIIKINQTVFVHGGISLADSKRPLNEINDLYHSELRRASNGEDFPARLLYARDGPTWNRAFSDSTHLESDYEASVDQILANLGARRIIVAHTPTIDENKMVRFGDKVFIIDTGISRSYRGGFLSALIMNDGYIRIWKGEHHD